MGATTPSAKSDGTNLNWNIVADVGLRGRAVLCHLPDENGNPCSVICLGKTRIMSCDRCDEESMVKLWNGKLDGEIQPAICGDDLCQQ